MSIKRYKFQLKNDANTDCFDNDEEEEGENLLEDWPDRKALDSDFRGY